MEIHTNNRYKDFKVIFECEAGSNLYGTKTEFSDTDIRGVFIPTKEYFLGFMNNIEQVEESSHDIVHYDIRKFFNLAVKCNPSVIEFLFVPENMCTIVEDEWRNIMINRKLFLSTKSRFTFSGYAVSQLHRIKLHRNWLLSPPKKQPTRSDFGLPEDKTLVTKDQLNAFDELRENFDYDLIDAFQLDINSLTVLQREKAFQNANKYWHQYENWKKTRNPARAKLEEKYGYDTKHTSHLVRLLSEGEELLSTGFITLPRPDADHLLDVKNGKFSYDELMGMIGNIDERFDALYVNSVLPRTASVKEADKLCIELVERSLNNANRLHRHNF